MSVENDANNANYEELAGHCKVLSAKLSQMTSGQSTVQSALEDLEDYYERSVQMRVMHNNTLKEEIRELQEEKAAIVQRALGCALFVCLGIATLLVCMYPAAFLSFAFAYWSYGVVATASMFVGSFAVHKTAHRKTL